MITVSIVSHAQGALAADLLRDLAALGRDDLRVILTLNVPEEAPDGHGLQLEIIRNRARLGFGANHNQALKHSRDEWCCILNPDVRLPQDPFPALLEALRPEGVGLAAPRVQSPAGAVENNARRFPTFTSLAAKGLGLAPQRDYADSDAAFSPDWVAGMFMLAKRAAFEAVGGFDEKYFLYYEDVDLCRRLRRGGYDIRLVPAAQVVHDARRSSHRNPKYLAWHLRSILRYLRTRY
jgi:GT2 family glycosyltransferase